MFLLPAVGVRLVGRGLQDERVVTVLSTRSVLRAVLPSVFAWEASAASTDVDADGPSVVPSVDTVLVVVVVAVGLSSAPPQAEIISRRRGPRASRRITGIAFMIATLNMLEMYQVIDSNL